MRRERDTKRAAIRAATGKALLPALYALVAAAALLAYAGSITDQFLWDDDMVIVNNAALHSWGNLPLLFDRDRYFTQFTELSYRPIVSFTYFVDFALFDLNATGYHAHNVLLHTGAALLVFALLCTLPMARGAAFAGALLFAIHPAGTEVVNIASFREDLLCLIFSMAGLLSFRRYRLDGGWGWLAGSVAAIFFAVFTKESGVIALPALIVYDLTALRAAAGPPERAPTIRDRLLSYVGPAAAVAAYLPVRFVWFTCPDESAVPYLGGSLGSAIVSAVPIFWMYARIYTFPFSLSATYDFGSQPVGAMILPGLALPALIAGGLWLIRRSPAGLFLTAWTLLFLGPVSNVLPLGNPAADRYLYLPLVGVAGLAGLGLFGWPASSRALAVLRIAGFAATAVLLLVLTTERNAAWGTNNTVWRNAYIVAPRVSTGIYNAGKQYESRGLFKKAIGAYRRAFELEPKSAWAALNWARALEEDGQYEESIRRYEEMIARGQMKSRALNNIGNILLKQGKLDEAIAKLNESLAEDPGSPVMLTNLAQANYRAGRTDEALRLCDEISRRDPEFHLHLFLVGDIYTRAGDPARAEAAFREALRRSRDHVTARLALAKFFANARRPADSARELVEVLRRAPDSQEAREILEQQVSVLASGLAPGELARAFAQCPASGRLLVEGMIQLALRRVDLAVRSLEAAADADRGFALPCMQLAQLYNETQRPAKELAELRRILKRLPRRSALTADVRNKINELRRITGQ